MILCCLFAQVAKLVRRSSRIVALTGAGISVESGPHVSNVNGGAVWFESGLREVAATCLMVVVVVLECIHARNDMSKPRAPL